MSPHVPSLQAKRPLGHAARRRSSRVRAHVRHVHATLRVLCGRHRRRTSLNAGWVLRAGLSEAVSTRVRARRRVGRAPAATRVMRMAPAPTRRTGRIGKTASTARHAFQSRCAAHFSARPRQSGTSRGRPATRRVPPTSARAWAGDGGYISRESPKVSCLQLTFEPTLAGASWARCERVDVTGGSAARSRLPGGALKSPRERAGTLMRTSLLQPKGQSRRCRV